MTEAWHRLGHGAGGSFALCSGDVDDAELVELIFGDGAGRGRGRGRRRRRASAAVVCCARAALLFFSDHQPGPLQAQSHHLHRVLPLPGPAVAAGAPGDERSELGEDALVVSVEVRVGGGGRGRGNGSSSSSISVGADSGGCFGATGDGVACRALDGASRWKLSRGWHLNLGQIEGAEASLSEGRRTKCTDDFRRAFFDRTREKSAEGKERKRESIKTQLSFALLLLLPRASGHGATPTIAKSEREAGL